jgi:SAM-dependent methyltransferase
MKDPRFYFRPCKLCGGNARYAGSLDQNKCCIDGYGTKLLPPSETRVPYYICENCGFIFTDFCDAWSAAEFKEKIYNSQYDIVNPPVPGRQNVPVRETPSYQTGQRIARLLDGSQSAIRLLDYGAGGDPGPTGQALLDLGFTLDSYDPYRAGGTEPVGLYDVIVAIEVLEHCHDPRAVAAQIARHLAPGGLLWVHTMLHPHPAGDEILQSWYIAPRDGHISIHTLPSLTIMCNAVGLNLVQTALGVFAFRRLPSFPNKIFLPA